jgi:hypothetical protein
MFNTMLRRQTIGSMLFAATLATLPLSACTQSERSVPRSDRRERRAHLYGCVACPRD